MSFSNILNKPSYSIQPINPSVAPILDNLSQKFIKQQITCNKLMNVYTKYCTDYEQNMKQLPRFNSQQNSSIQDKSIIIQKKYEFYKNQLDYCMKIIDANELVIMAYNQLEGNIKEQVHEVIRMQNSENLRVPALVEIKLSLIQLEAKINNLVKSLYGEQNIIIRDKPLLIKLMHNLKEDSEKLAKQYS